MTVHVKPHLEAMLKAQVDAGHFDSVEEALEAAILGLEELTEEGHLQWLKSQLDAADSDFAAGRSASHDEVVAGIARRRATR